MIEEENGQNDSRSIVFIDGLWKMGEFIVHVHYIREMEHLHLMDEDRYPTVVCTWRVLRKNRNRQFFDLSGLSSLLVLYLAMGANPPTSVPNYRLFWPCRKMKGNRSGFRVKPRQLHTTNPLAIANSLTVGCCGCCAMVSNGEQWLVVACNGW